jgi:hypothetical protein
VRKNQRAWKLGEAKDKVVGLREIRGRILAVAHVCGRQLGLTHMGETVPFGSLKASGVLCR